MPLIKDQLDAKKFKQYLEMKMDDLPSAQKTKAGHFGTHNHICFYFARLCGHRICILLHKEALERCPKETQVQDNRATSSVYSAARQSTQQVPRPGHMLHLSR